MATNVQTQSAAIGNRHSVTPPKTGLDCASWRVMALDKGRWDGLVHSAAEPNPFYEGWYLLPSLENIDVRRKVSILRLTHQGELCGLMPIVRHSLYGGWPLAHISNWLHPNIFIGTPLVASGAEDLFWRALLDWADVNAGRSLFLHLNEIALAGPVFESMSSVLADDGRAWGVVERKERALLASGLDAEELLAESLSTRSRKDLNRRMRKLSELGEIDFRWETGSGGLVQWIDDFLALEASGWKGKAGSALACDRATKTLFQRSLVGAASRERLVRLSLCVNGKPIAMLSTFLTPPGAFGFKTAFDEDYARFAPGLLLEREFLAAPYRFDIKWCDSCAAPDHSVMNRIWRERRLLGRVSIAIGGPLRRAFFSRLLRREIAGLDTGSDT